MPKLQDEDKGYTEYLRAVYELSSTKNNKEKYQDTIVKVSNFVPEPKSLNQVLKLNGHIREKWGNNNIRGEINSLFENGTFLT